MALVPGVDEYLSLGLGELPQPDHTLTGRDLISKGLADLHRSKGQAVAEVAQEPGEVDEHALCSLRAEVAGHLIARADHGLEHEVELVDLGELSATLRTADLVVLNAAIDLLIAESIRHLHDVLDEVVGPVDLLAIFATGERIGEAAQVA